VICVGVNFLKKNWFKGRIETEAIGSAREALTVWADVAQQEILKKRESAKTKIQLRQSLPESPKSTTENKEIIQKKKEKEIEQIKPPSETPVPPEPIRTITPLETKPTRGSKLSRSPPPPSIFARVVDNLDTLFFFVLLLGTLFSVSFVWKAELTGIDIVLLVGVCVNILMAWRLDKKLCSIQKELTSSKKDE